MPTPDSWPRRIEAANRAFTARVDPRALPTERAPGPAIVTCMDPRVDLAAIGIPAFGDDGANDSTVRIVRTLGARLEPRSLLVGVFLAGISEIAVLMHTDCGACLAHAKIDTLIERLHERLPEERSTAFRRSVGEPFREELRTWLGTFEDPREAVAREVEAIRSLPFAPDDLVVHGLVYTLGTGAVEVVVDGSA